MSLEPSVPERAAPAVVAVIVVCDAGPWLEESLAAFAGQDYPNLSVLVIDAGSALDPTSRVAAALPDAFVRLLGERRTFGTAANAAIGVVEGASHYLVCHDDVAPDPDAVRLMVEEAFRSNAGLVTPKYVAWDDPSLLLGVGQAADRVGVVTPLVDPGELDQEQHDSVRDVFVAPSGATLVRADLFATVGGFDPLIADHGEDLDLSWRAHVAGARVVAAPAARVRHLEASRRGLRSHQGAAAGTRSDAALADDNRLRTLVTCSSPLTLAWLLPLAVFFLVGEATTALLSGRPGPAATLVSTPLRALRRPGSLWRSRRRVHGYRSVHDRQIRQLQSAGNARFRAWVRVRIDDPHSGRSFAVPTSAEVDDDDRYWVGPSRPRRFGPAGPPRVSLDGPEAVAAPGQERGDDAGGEPAATAPAAGWQARRWQLPAATTIIGLVVLAVGSRSLLVHTLPDVWSIPPTSGGVASWWRSWLATWQPAGLGSVGTSPPVLALMAAAGVVLFGAKGTLQHVLVLGPLLVGPIGAYRMAKPWGGRRGRVAAMVAYLVAPIAYDAVGAGDWPALVVYAAAPWMLAGLARISDALPHPGTAARSILGRVVAVGLLTGLVAAVSPSFLVVVPVAAVAMAAGSLAAGQPAVGMRLAAVGVAAAVVAFVLLLPWSVGVMANGNALWGGASTASAGSSFGALLHLDTGPIGRGPLGWGLLVAAALPLAIGRSWRLAWASRFWTTALAFVVWAWAGARGDLPAPPVQVLLAVAAAALAGAVALGAIAFEQDLPGYRFGWRQAASGVAAVALAVAALPVLAASGNGRWHLAPSGPAAALQAVNGAPGGDYRVLWVGPPQSLPLASTPAGRGVAWATSFDGLPGLADLWAPGTPNGSAAVVDDLHLAEGGLTTSLGHLLAPLGVRFLVVPGRGAPGAGLPAASPSLGPLVAGLGAQTDLEPLDVGPATGYRVYQNVAWFPVRAALPPGLAALARRASSPDAVAGASVAGVVPALHGRDPDGARGVLDPGASVYVAASAARRWRLRLDGAVLRAAPAFGSGMVFTLPSGVGGPAALTVTGSTAVHVGQVVELLVVAGGVVVVAVDRRRRNRRPGTETVRAEWFSPLPSERRTSRVATTPDVPVGVGDEGWADG